MRFKPNQKLVCTATSDGHWKQVTDLNWLQYLGLQSKLTTGPRFNDIITVDDHDNEDSSIALKEYRTYKSGRRDTFFEVYFEPLISDNILEAELASCREPDFI